MVSGLSPVILTWLLYVKDVGYVMETLEEADRFMDPAVNPYLTVGLLSFEKVFQETYIPVSPAYARRT